MKEEKIYEAEIIKDKVEKKVEEKFQNIDDEIRGFKNMVLLKGIGILITPILVFILIFSGLVALIYLFFDHPWDHILVAFLVFILLKTIYKFWKIFRKF